MTMMCVILHEQVQAIAHFDDVRLKSEKAGIYIVTYQLLRAPNHGGLLSASLKCHRFYDVWLAELYR